MKKYRRDMSHDTEKWCKVYRKNDYGSKNDIENLVNFNASSSKYGSLRFNVLLLLEVYYVCAKKIQRSYVSYAEEWWKIWGGTDLCFEKWHEEFGEL